MKYEMDQNYRQQYLFSFIDFIICCAIAFLWFSTNGKQLKGAESKVQSVLQELFASTKDFDD